MFTWNPHTPIDYLIIGHVTCDLTPHGNQLGGTAAYASLTAHALGMRVGIVTAVGQDVSTEAIGHIPFTGIQEEKSTTFENIDTPTGRLQILHHAAPTLSIRHIPEPWRKAPIVHLGPVVHEIDLSILRFLSEALIGVTPQGWLRDWDAQGRVFPAEWPEATYVLGKANAVVLSREDVGGDEQRINEIITASPLTVVTEAENGARLYMRGEEFHMPAPKMDVANAVGAGDIFAAAFFTLLHQTQDPYQALQHATQLASFSVARTGLDSVPTQEEIQTCMMKV